jgi:Holliday junction DNA helicase RuvB
MGKTALATAIAREYGRARPDATISNFTRILAGARITRTIVEKLSALDFGDFLFVDEIHSLDREAQELLNIAIDERRTLACVDDKLDRGQSQSVAEFTLIGATTEPGKMTHALRSRLIQITLDPYELRELKAIAEKAASDLGLKLTAQAARHLAERSQQTPRSIEGLLRRLAVTRYGVVAVDQQVVRSFLEELGIDERGLEGVQQRYLKTLAAAAGRPTSLTVLESRLGMDPAYLRSDVEPHLLHLGLVEIGAGGRSLTEKGRGVAEQLVGLPEPAEPTEESDLIQGTEES